MNDQRPAERADCVGCRNESFFVPEKDQRCWSFATAVMVPKLRVREGLPVESAETVVRPRCYSQRGWLHLTPINGQPRSTWKGGDAA